MATIKIGENEIELIGQINKFKEKYKARLEDIRFGVELAEKQIPDSADEKIRNVRSGIKRVKDTVQKLVVLIEKINFSEEFDEEKFWISWWEYNDATQTNYDHAYGKIYSTEPVTEKQFVYALVSWEKEICKRLMLLKEFQGIGYQRFWSEIEQELHNIVNSYIYTDST